MDNLMPVLTETRWNALHPTVQWKILMLLNPSQEPSRGSATHPPGCHCHACDEGGS